MKCPNCGCTMVEKPPKVIYTSNPPQFDSVMWCACGYTHNIGRVCGISEQDFILYSWKRANKGLK